MQNKKKIAIAIMSVAVGVTMVSSQAQAASSWKDYFSQNEASSMKKYISSYIQDQLESGKNEWKGIVSGKSIDDGAVSADKVDQSIAKRKIFTGTINCATNPAAAADKTTNDNGEITYWKKVSIPEIKLTNVPQVLLYSKYAADSEEAQLASDIWSIDGADVSEGAVWIDYGNNGTGLGCEVPEYKIVVNY